MLWPKKNSYKEFDNEKKFLRLENSLLPPPLHNFSNGPSLKGKGYLCSSPIFLQGTETLVSPFGDACSGVFILLKEFFAKRVLFRIYINARAS